MREGLKVQRAGGDAVDRKYRQAAKSSSCGGDQQRLNGEGGDDAGCAKTDGTHAGNLPGALGHGGIHGVERAKHSSNSHDEGNHSSEELDHPCEDCRLRGVIVTLVAYVHVHAWIRADCILELLQTARRCQVHSYRLERVLRAVIDLVENRGIAPDFGIKGRTACVEDSDDAPGSSAERDAVAEREPGVSLIDIASDHELRQSGLEESSLDDLDVVADFECLRRDTPYLDVGIGAGG